MGETKLDLFKRYLEMKRSYYAGSPEVSDYDYDMFEMKCREKFPDDDDFYLAGYGDRHEERLAELENSNGL